MKPVKEAKRYAKTFISIVGLEDVPEALAELTIIEQLMLKSKDFKNLLVNPGFSQEERENAFKQVASRLGISERMTKFVLHLVDIRVIIALSQVIKTATAIYLERKKRAKATILTPIEISKDLEERLKVSLKKLVERDVDIEYVIDQSLFGGVLVKVGSTMYDSSIKGQLRLLKDELIKG